MPLGPRLALQGLHSGVDKINGSWILAVLMRLCLPRLPMAKCSQRLPQYDLIVVTASDEGYISELLFLTHLTPAIEDREPRSD